MEPASPTRALPLRARIVLRRLRRYHKVRGACSFVLVSVALAALVVASLWPDGASALRQCHVATGIYTPCPVSNETQAVKVLTALETSQCIEACRVDLTCERGYWLRQSRDSIPGFGESACHLVTADATERECA